MARWAAAAMFVTKALVQPEPAAVQPNASTTMDAAVSSVVQQRLPQWQHCEGVASATAAAAVQDGAQEGDSRGQHAPVPGRSQLACELADVLLPDELAWLLDQRHRPLAVAQAISAIVASAEIDATIRWRLDSNLSMFVLKFGACVRIYNTSIPRPYTRCVQSKSAAAAVAGLACCPICSLTA